MARGLGAVFDRLAVTRSVRGMTIVLIVVSVLAAAGLVASGWFGWQAWSDRDRDAARGAAVAAARQVVTNFVTLDAKTADKDLKRVLSGATGDFQKEYSAGLSQVKTAVTQNKVDSKGHVLSAALESSSATSASVLLAVDATVKNTQAPNGRLSHYRIRVSMQYTHDKQHPHDEWLAAKLDFVA